MAIYLKKKQRKSITDIRQNNSKSQKQHEEVDIETFKSALSEVDSQMKTLPAVAQVKQRRQVPLKHSDFLYLFTLLCIFILFS